MKSTKIFFAALAFLVSILILNHQTLAAGTATVTATVTFQNISVSVADSSIAYGTLGTGASADTTSGSKNDTQVASNDGNIAEDFNIKGQNTTAWTLAAATGADQYVHDFCTAGSGTPDPCDASATWTALTSNYATLGSDVAASGNKRFDLKITVPTSSSSYSEQSVDLTVQAILHV